MVLDWKTITQKLEINSNDSGNMYSALDAMACHVTSPTRVKGALARESRTRDRLVSPALGREKIFGQPEIWVKF